MKVVHTSGKRKKAIARATLREGKGKIWINRIHLDDIYPRMSRMKLREPLLLAGDIAHKVDISVRVKGGGVSGQTEAARLAIARSLVEYSKGEKLRKVFLNYDRHLLVADVRRGEPSKPNVSKPRKKRQKSYR